MQTHWRVKIINQCDPAIRSWAWEETVRSTCARSTPDPASPFNSNESPSARTGGHCQGWRDPRLPHPAPRGHRARRLHAMSCHAQTRPSPAPSAAARTNVVRAASGVVGQFGSERVFDRGVELSACATSEFGEGPIVGPGEAVGPSLVSAWWASQVGRDPPTVVLQGGRLKTNSVAVSCATCNQAHPLKQTSPHPPLLDAAVLRAGLVLLDRPQATAPTYGRPLP